MTTMILFNKTCLYDDINNKTIIYGQYKRKFNTISIENEEGKPIYEYKVEFCRNRKDFYVEFCNKITHIKEVSFNYNSQQVKMNNILLQFPFDGFDLSLNSKSSIISTFCKDYAFRLDEWIEYNLKLGFSGIIVFNNDGNKKNPINEPESRTDIVCSTSEICKKYKGKVWEIEYDYEPLICNHYDTLQRISLHIGVNALKNKCRRIALIDADEFIYLPKNPEMKIEDFLQTYNGNAVTMKSNILTNIGEDDIINNNVLDIAVYVGEDKYTKTILDTGLLSHLDFIVTPHNHPTEVILEKSEIIHYHCWINKRYPYNDSMPKIEFLKNDNEYIQLQNKN
jgi:hypothetical protein